MQALSILSSRAARILTFALLVALVAGCARDAAELQIVQQDPEEAARQAKAIREEVSVEVADGLTLALWASDTLLADPIALAIDDHGRAFVTRTLRQQNSEFDIRGHQDWMLRSIGLRTVEDRRAFLHEVFAPERSDTNAWLPDLNADSSHDWRDLAVEKERVYRIEDTSGDGVADRSQRYTEDFGTEVTDIAGAVLPYGDDVYVGVAPDLWRLRDRNGDGQADFKESISHGYGVHIGFSGHNMSGLTVGPDGRLYWSIGDIGFHVVDKEGKTWAYPNQGAILRSEPDGTGFEVFAAGLRNTHEFVFDAYGNLISVDNDGDHPGEHERVVYVVEGSDAGWRANWQYGKYTDPRNNDYNVWMDEGLFKPRFDAQAAYITPPVAAYHSGPAGMAYNPGTALGERWQGRFFVAEFVGSPARSRIFAFELEPEGAGFRLGEEEVVTRGLLATGLDFGPDGALYVADWVTGWGTKQKGRIWKLDDSTAAAAPLRAETQALLAEDLTGRDDDALVQLLRHPDMRVRMKAQFALAGRGTAGTLLAAAQEPGHQLARLHALWGLGQLARRDPDAARPLVDFLRDDDPEVRAQAAKVLGDVRYAPAGGTLVPLLRDDAPRARFFAAEALGRIAFAPAFGELVAMLAANDDGDTYLRHAGALALARIAQATGEAERIVALADHPSRAVRIAAVVALRRLEHPGVARFLRDADTYVVTEAARAVNDDTSIEAALPELARVLDQTNPTALVEERYTNEPLLRRAVNAALRVGGPEQARRLAAFAGRRSAPPALRAEALDALGVWADASVVDRVDGTHRGPLAHDRAAAHAALAGTVDALLADTSALVRATTAGTVGRLQYAPAFAALFDLEARDPAPAVRIAALEALRAGGYDDMEAAVERALADRDARVRMAALGVVPSLDLPEERAVALLASVLGDERTSDMAGGTVEERQHALEALGAIHHPAAYAVLDGLFDRLEAGTLAPEIQLDVLEAVEAGASEPLKARLAQYRAAAPAATGGGAVAAYRETLQGGDVDRGRRLFYQHPAGQCVRCHVVGDYGGDVGPALSDIGARYTREEILRSLVDPSARIAPGYGIVAVTLAGGETVRGTLREETPAHLVLETADGARRRIPREAVTARQEAPSGMPPMGAVLRRREIRDLVAFLAAQQGP